MVGLQNQLSDQFTEEIQVYITSRSPDFTNSHQFESTKSLYKLPLEASNLYLQLDSFSYKSKSYMPIPQL